MSQAKRVRPTLSVHELSVRAGGRSVLHKVSLDVAAGEVVAVLGPNGSGKSTLLETIAGLRAGYSGRVSLEGKELRTFSERTRCLALMPDQQLLPEEARLGVALGLSRSDELVTAFGLEGLLSARATELSRGESKRAQLAATLTLRRPVALLDEPFGAFDPRQMLRLLPLFRSATTRMAVLVTVHQMRTAELIADRLLLLSAGRALAFGTLEELRSHAGAPGASLDDVFLHLLEREANNAES